MAVPVAPEVLVVSNLGTPMAGVDVSFSVTRGGGQVQRTQARTDAAGRASSGSWRLGVTKGTNLLAASVSGLPPVKFTARAANVSSAIATTVLQPTSDQMIGDSYQVIAKVIATQSLASVTATMNGRTIPLSLTDVGGGIGQAWTGTDSSTNLPGGDLDLVVTATDVLSNTTDAIVPLVHLDLPRVTVAEPLSESVVPTSVKIVASCTGSGQTRCTSLSARIEDTHVVATGTDFISKVVDLTLYLGRKVRLVFDIVDAAGRQSSITQTLYVEDGPGLQRVVDVAGPVWDVLGSRVLYLDISTALPSLKVLDLTTGSTVLVDSGPGLLDRQGGPGYLTQTGAIYVKGSVDGSSAVPLLAEWRSGSLIALGEITRSGNFGVAGDWAVYTRPPNSTLWIRDLLSGVSSAQATAAVSGPGALAANGDVIYTSNSTGPTGRNIYRLRGGTAQALTQDGGASLYNQEPQTDGIGVVYLKSAACCGSGPFLIAYHDGSVESIVSNVSGLNAVNRKYAIANGHLAYIAPDANQIGQVWRRSAGVDLQLTFFTANSTVDIIGPDGTVLLNQLGKRRYLVRPGGVPADIGTYLGRVVYRNGNFFVLMGRSVFKVRP